MMQNNPLEEIRREKRRVRKELRKSRQRLKDSVQNLRKPVDRSTDKVSTFAGYLHNGLAIWQGIRIGLNFIRAFRRVVR